MSISVSNAYNDLAGKAQNHRLRQAVLTITGLTANAANTVPHGLPSTPFTVQFVADAASSGTTVVNATAQAAAITTTALLTAPASALYKLSYYHLLSQAATSSSSTQLTIGWTDPTGTAQTATNSAITGNALGDFNDGEVIIIPDGTHNITYAVAYSSTGATAMNFDIHLAIAPASLPVAFETSAADATNVYITTGAGQTAVQAVCLY